MMNTTVNTGSHLTLHYCIRLADAPHTEVLSTYGGHPATLVLGSGELAPGFERCLLGLSVGGPQAFQLDADAAFGAWRDDLLQQLPRAAFPETADVAAGQVLEFTAPDGGRYAGVIKQFDGAQALVDFNHPLAGKPVQFEATILAIL